MYIYCYCGDLVGGGPHTEDGVLVVPGPVPAPLQGQVLPAAAHSSYTG